MPIRSDRTFAGLGYSTTWWCRAKIQHASGYCAARDLNSLHLLGRHHAKRICEGEMRIRIRVQENDAKPVAAVGGHDHRKGSRPEIVQAPGQEWPCGVEKSRNFGIMWLTRLSEAAANAVAGAINQSDTFALDDIGGRQEPEPPQASVGACREIEAGGIARSTMLRS